MTFIAPVVTVLLSLLFVFVGIRWIRPWREQQRQKPPKVSIPLFPEAKEMTDLPIKVEEAKAA